MFSLIFCYTIYNLDDGGVVPAVTSFFGVRGFSLWRGKTVGTGKSAQSGERRFVNIFSFLFAACVLQKKK